jgi:amino acid permease
MSESLFRKKTIAQLTKEGNEPGHGGGLKRVLTARDLTFFGIAAILGAGSFSSLGGAIFGGGPGVVTQILRVAYPLQVVLILMLMQVLASFSPGLSGGR